MNTERLTAVGVIPVVVIDDPARAAGLGEALIAGGLPIAEITLRTSGALDSIAELAGLTDLLVGAGTVLTAHQVHQVVDAGARFVVSPGLSSAVVSACREREVPVVPGCVTATEVMAALDQGVTLVKFFPAATSGGPEAIKALAAPFRNVSFIPTGGITPDNARDYLSLACVSAIGGSWMVPTDAVAAGETTRISTLCREAVSLVAELTATR